MTRWWVIIAAGLAVFMASVDLSITNVSLPTLGHFFVVPPSALEWVVLAYSLPAVALLLPLGRWIDTVALRGAFLLCTGYLGHPLPQQENMGVTEEQERGFSCRGDTF